MFIPQRINDLIINRQLANKKMKILDVASDIGISYTSLNTIRQGTTNPSIEIMERLCKYFDVDMNYFFDNQDWPSIGREMEPETVVSDHISKYGDKSVPSLMSRIIDLQDKIIEVQEKLSKKEEDLTKIMQENVYLKNVSATERSAKAG